MWRDNHIKRNWKSYLNYYGPLNSFPYYFSIFPSSLLPSFVTYLHFSFLFCYLSLSVTYLSCYLSLFCYLSSLPFSFQLFISLPSSPLPPSVTYIWFSFQLSRPSSLLFSFFLIFSIFMFSSILYFSFSFSSCFFFSSLLFLLRLLLLPQNSSVYFLLCLDEERDDYIYKKNKDRIQIITYLFPSFYSFLSLFILFFLLLNSFLYFLLCLDEESEWEIITYKTG